MYKKDMHIPQISLRNLKAMASVARYANLTRAANRLNRSQTAITKAISDLETQLSVRLFDRSPRGMQLTAHGKVLLSRVEQVEEEFRQAGVSYNTFTAKSQEGQSNPVFSMDISYKRLASFVTVFDTGSISVSANRLGITKHAIYQSLRQLEELLELTLFEKTPGGVVPSAFCTLLARHIKLAFAQIRHGMNELKSLSGVTRGYVSFGTLPYSRTIISPRAIDHLLKTHPHIDIYTSEGAYPLLESSLRSGDLDFIVGAIREDNENQGLTTEKLFEDKLSVIVRKGHELESCLEVSLGDINQYDWVLPPPNTPTRLLFDAVLKKQNLTTPQHIIETSSLSIVRGLLLESDRIALLSEHQIYYDKKYGVLDALPIHLGDTYRPIGITMRSHTEPSPAAKLFLRSLREVSKEYFSGN